MAINYQKLSTATDEDDELVYHDDNILTSKSFVCRRHPFGCKHWIVLAVVCLAAVIIMLVTVAIEVACMPDEITQVVFESGMKGYSIFRIPAIVYHQQYFLTFAEARHGISDSTKSDIIMRRGLLQKSKVKWEDPQILASMRGKRLMGPVSVVDKETDTIWLMYNILPKDKKESELISADHYDQSLFIINSTDLGVTWSLPRNITHETLGTMNPVPSLFAPGPGHGIQLSSGRLILPGNFYAKDHNTDHKMFEYGAYCHSTVLISDDHGATWRPGGYVPYWEDKDGKFIETNEPSVAEISPDELILNARTLPKHQPRAQSISYDGSETFGAPELIPNLIEPNNMGPYAGVAGSILSFPHVSSTTNRTWCLFSNTANRRWRFGMSIRLSQDGCQSWSKPWTIWSWGSAYSDLTQINTEQENFENPAFAILYERGCLFSSYKTISMRIFRLNEVMKGIGIKVDSLKSDIPMT